MSLAGKIGRLGTLYVKEESTYGVAPTLAASNGVRHLNCAFNFSPRNRVDSLEKKQSPGTVNRFTRRASAELAALQAYMYPSGALNTLPEAHLLYKNTFGTFTNVTQSSTVLTAASSPAEAAPTTTTFAISDIGAWVVGDLCLITTSDGAFVRRIKTIAAAVGTAPKKLVTVAPALPGAPTLGNTVKGGVTYKLTTDIVQSVFLAHYLTNFGRGVTGVMLDKCKLSFDSNKEPEFNISGPGRGQQSSQGDGPFGMVQSIPGGFTMVGAGNIIPSGLTGGLYFEALGYSDITFKFLKADFEMTNGLKVRNETYGTFAAEEGYRSKRRTVPISFDTRLEDTTDIYSLSEITTIPSELLIQTGNTQGRIWAIDAPNVEWDMPQQPDGEEEITWAFKGMALESVDGANDEIYLGAF